MSSYSWAWLVPIVLLVLCSATCFTNDNAKPAVWIMEGDDAPPVITCSLHNNSYFRGGKLDVSWRVEDNESGLSHIWIYYDGGLRYTKGFNGEKSYTASALGLILQYQREGMHNYTLVAMDLAGNTAKHTTLFYVDRTVPSGRIIHPDNGSLVAGKILVVLNVTDNLSPIVRARLAAGGTAINVTGLDAYELDTSIFHDGELEITLYVEDLAGNENADAVTIVIDNTPPILNISSPVNKTIYPGPITIEYSVDDPHYAETWYALDGRWTNITGKTTVTIDTTEYSDSYYPLTILANDTLGNTVEETLIIGIDNTPPTIEVLSPINNTEIALGTKINLTLRIRFIDPNLATGLGGSKPKPEPEEPEEKILIDGAPVVSRALEHVDETVSTIVLDTAGWSPGAHLITIIIKDAAGHLTRATITVNIRQQSTTTTEDTGAQTHATASPAPSATTPTKPLETAPQQLGLTAGIAVVIIAIAGFFIYLVFIRK